MLNDEFEHGLRRLVRKDLKICLDAEIATGILPVTSCCQFKNIQKMGGGRWDTSSLFKQPTIDKLN